MEAISSVIQRTAALTEMSQILGLAYDSASQRYQA
jgi:hypothetical protein